MILAILLKFVFIEFELGSVVVPTDETTMILVFLVDFSWILWLLIVGWLFLVCWALIMEEFLALKILFLFPHFLIKET